MAYNKDERKTRPDKTKASQKKQDEANKKLRVGDMTQRKSNIVNKTKTGRRNGRTRQNKTRQRQKQDKKSLKQRQAKDKTRQCISRKDKTRHKTRQVMRQGMARQDKG